MFFSKFVDVRCTTSRSSFGVAAELLLSEALDVSVAMLEPHINAKRNSESERRIVRLRFIVWVA